MILVKSKPLIIFIFILFYIHQSFAEDLSKPIVDEYVVFQESGGMVVVEAEHFFKQEKTEKRAWYLTTKDMQSGFQPDADKNNVAGASGGAYMEILPDTRKNHSEKLIKGENFINEPGEMAVLSYKINFQTPGRYYVWARIFSTGTEDNGVHVGIDGKWPESGQRMQWTAKRHWAWGSKQRTEEVHVGVAGILFLNIDNPGEHVIQFSMREDGFEFDQFMMTTDKGFEMPSGPLQPSPLASGKTPKPFEFVKVSQLKSQSNPASTLKKATQISEMSINDFHDINGGYIDRNKWVAVDPNKDGSSISTGAWPFNSGVFNITLHFVGENDGQSKYTLINEGEVIGTCIAPLSSEIFEEGLKFSKTFKNIRIDAKSKIQVKAEIGSLDGSEFSRARWSKISVKPANDQKLMRLVESDYKNVKSSQNEKKISFVGKIFGSRGESGSGAISIHGEKRTWHKIVLDLKGPFAHEKDNKPNPFTDYRFDVTFKHEDGFSEFTVPGFFAADGSAGETSAESGNIWRAIIAPDLPGKWFYQTHFIQGKNAALTGVGDRVPQYDKRSGSFIVRKTNKSGRDLRGKGRLAYVGKNHLQYKESGEWFVKAGADAPETFLGYKDFDGTVANKTKVPLKTWKPHIKDWKKNDPTWKGSKGKGIIGAINYLSSTGCNVFSFLTYNAGGDGDNVWPFVERNDPLNYDCSKLDQWGIVFEHGTRKGMYLHFKMQETENDDLNRGGKTKANVPTALDGGDLGLERKLYCRELIARFSHNLAINWNLGEENTQTVDQQRAMARYIEDLDPYDHIIVVHTYPNQQDKVYAPLLGNGSVLSGASLQNSNIRDCHHQVVKWTSRSTKAGKPWVVGFDEPGTAGEGMPADPGYPGMPEGFNNPSVDDTRKFALWGTLMAGGSGVEYYFGYKLPQNDLLCEDWRSRDLSWKYCSIALEFFKSLPVGEMRNMDELVGNNKHDNSAYCFAKYNSIYLVYLPEGGKRTLDLTLAKGGFAMTWFNPRSGESQPAGFAINGGKTVDLEAPGSKNDWLAVIKRKRL